LDLFINAYTHDALREVIKQKFGNGDSDRIDFI